MNVGDLRWNSGECQGGSREHNVVGSPKFCDPAGLVQVSELPKCPKVLKGGWERCFRASGARVPKQSLARCETVFWGVSPGAIQGLHGARDSSGTLGPETPDRARPAGSQSSPNLGEHQSFAQKDVRAIDARNSQRENDSNAAKPVFALPGCHRMSVNTLLCDTLA